MTDYTPPLHEESSASLKNMSGDISILDFPTGSKYGSAGRVVSNDGLKIKICYQYSKENCSNCVVECPFNTRKNIES
ncbi:hypothetical protein A2130_04380 [Candidatus Woesebacteria bacterium GWC2_33_12]|uniref:4Fe-4S ferredoxin-type domain-containing protein n=1 Tax=Candidatus Woesebacteria bacterium GW2011_GWB1_33_22 TaxID=1618566 RepID=A0A0G0BZI1_9BACT|nr:MAG: hypothetical protein UR29_C0015G0028 [Candidatus Woesebacteria bacterium GW2011_GWC2_33_12]KKP41822.1 MAG: hypothetical protein UR33_C0009G0016 [Candidatus Woesebacteria bacterium GW2011_GWA2_33_20]KKP44320.1 MAG: hypothetical protein UR35_C0009G0031 [Candidatus Woesebacteria bacterium GW2011_GWB1_33_22]KKP46078.1 MAG: hypothetical protein UR37_C0012G0030 [Microgenomates group bacterium GW2011_GWC1_33_28]KKP49968.1 MAG: hypothetical protein UR41_C0011G0030 [Candidatus Woesebacteria bact